MVLWGNVLNIKIHFKYNILRVFCFVCVLYYLNIFLKKLLCSLMLSSLRILFSDISCLFSFFTDEISPSMSFCFLNNSYLFMSLLFFFHFFEMFWWHNITIRFIIAAAGYWCLLSLSFSPLLASLNKRCLFFALFFNSSIFDILWIWACDA